MKAFETLSEIIHARKTCKNFLGGDISHETLENLLKLAIRAPNHRLNEPWRFRVLQKSGIAAWKKFFEAKLSADEYAPFKIIFERLEKVPAVIHVTCKKDVNLEIDQENYAATAAAVEHILLGATALGLQSYWGTGKLAHCSPTWEFLKIPADERLVGVIWLGQGEITEAKPRAPLSEKVTWIE